MEIKVIGTNSSNRLKLIKNIKKATDNKINIQLLEKDNKYNITNTPALIINDKLISQGKVLNEREIKKFIEVLA
ncbi:MAG: thioredoxin family protein [Mollicutes bacterium]|nr:thioredoxin family protein [Mollicutes bacterium]MDY5875620.1 thioredoxin family protein [Bacilli bacterium]